MDHFQGAYLADNEFDIKLKQINQVSTIYAQIVLLRDKNA